MDLLELSTLHHCRQSRLNMFTKSIILLYWTLGLSGVFGMPEPQRAVQRATVGNTKLAADPSTKSNAMFMVTVISIRWETAADNVPGFLACECSCHPSEDGPMRTGLQIKSTTRETIRRLRYAVRRSSRSLGN